MSGIENGLIATDAGGHSAGAIVYYCVVDVSVDTLTEAWGGAGLDCGLLPAVRRPLICLRSALADAVREHGIRGGRHARVADPTTGVQQRVEYTIDVRDLAGGKGCVAVCDVATEEDSDKQRTIARAAFGGSPGHADQLEITGEIPSETIRRAYELARSKVHHSSLANMLASRCLVKLDGVSLRETGGVYYIPPKSVPMWNTITQALQRVGCKMFQIPAMQGKDACAAILDAVMREAQLAADTLTDELVESDMGPRALQGKVKTCDAALRKLERYEALLGENLATLKERMEALSVGYGEAALTALATLDAAAE